MTPSRTVLCPVDLSEPSEYTLHLASSLARNRRAGLVALHVAPPPVVVLGGLGGDATAVEQVTPEAYDELRAGLRRLQPPFPDVPVEHRLEKGDAATEILHVAEEAGCDLVVMGTHGRTGLDRLLMGSVAEEVLRKASCPVVAVKTTLSPMRLPGRTVLHPTDFSERSEAAFQLACGVVTDGGRLVVLHVASAARGSPVAQPGGYHEGLRNDLQRLQAPDPETHLERRLEEGDAAAEIVRVAHEINADLIVMGTHGRTGLARLLVGSVTEEVLLKAPCPVMTVKQPFSDARPSPDARPEGAGTGGLATETERPTVVGVFEDRRQAERAVGELRRAGFPEDRIGLVAREGAAAETDLAGCDTNTRAEEGMTAGVLTGGAAGALAGAVAAGLIPGVGPVVAAGVLAGAFGGAAIGGATGGILGTFVGMGIPEDEARLYECELLAGRALVTVRADGRAAEAIGILRRFGAYDASKGKPPAWQATGLP
jgi:nucleotide-binding universal stress UspA family protein